MSTEWIVILSQLPLVLYTIWNGIASYRSNVNKVKAERESALGGALNDAGETLQEAWAEIRTLRKELAEERIARKSLESEMRRWTRFASLLIDQANKAGLPPIPFPPESNPSTKKAPGT